MYTLLSILTDPGVTDQAASSSQNVWAVIGLLITGVVTPLVLWFVNKKAVRPPAPIAETREEVAVTPEGHPLSSGISNEMMSVLAGVWSRLSVLEAREEAWEKERQEIILHNEALMKMNQQLGAGLATLLKWIDAGAKPPTPEVSVEIREMVLKIMEQVRHEAEMEALRRK